MSSRSEIRARARKALGGNIFATTWLLVLVAGLIVNAIMGVVSFTYVGPLILTGPLSYGLIKVILKAVREQDSKVELGDLFKGFTEDFVGNFLTGLLVTLFTFLWSLLFVIPGIVKMYSYSMALYIKTDHPEYTAKQCIDESRKMMNGHKMELFLLQLSFIGWMFVGALCLGVGTLWVNAYMQTANACFYEELKNQPVVEG
ncbi:MAG: DUF975 family protein [Eubacteriales bacterium]